MDKKISAACGAVLSLLLIWLAFRNADLGRIGSLLGSAEPLLLLPVFFTVSAELVLRGIKWKLLLAPSVKVRFGETLRLETASLALNNVLPLRLGDLARGFIGAGMFRTSALTVFSTILAEKVLDASALLLTAFLAAGSSRIIPNSQLSLLGGLVILAAVFFLLLYFYRSNGIFQVRVSFFFNKFPGLKNNLQKLGLGFKAFNSVPSACYIMLLALAQWFMNALGYYWTAKAFGLGGQVTVSKSAILSFAGASASSIPSAPGSFGNFEFAVAAVLSLWGVPKETALACSLGVHLLFYAIITVSGIIFLNSLGYTPAAVSRLFGKKDI